MIKKQRTNTLNWC